MTTFFPAALLAALLDDLENFADVSDNDIAATLQYVERTATALQQLNGYLQKELFDEQAQEIQVFKQIKPQIEGRLIYYIRLLAIQQLSPQTGEKQRQSYFRHHANRVQDWLYRHKEDYLYYKIGATYHDASFFLRQDSFPLGGLYAVRIVTDRQIQTLKSYQFALFMAADLLLQYFKKQISPSETQVHPNPGAETIPLISWTGSQADLTELVYALNEMGVLGNQRHEIQKVKTFFEKIFNTNLGNIYKTYEHNRLRKKSRTPFLDGVRMALIRRYDHDDEHAL